MRHLHNRLVIKVTVEVMLEQIEKSDAVKVECA